MLDVMEFREVRWRMLFFSSEKFGDSNFFRTFAPSVPAKPLFDAQMRGAFYLIYIQIWPNDILQNLILLHRSWCNFFVPEDWKSVMNGKQKISDVIVCRLICIRFWNLPNMNTQWWIFLLHQSWHTMIALFLSVFSIFSFQYFVCENNFFKYLFEYSK